MCLKSFEIFTEDWTDFWSESDFSEIFNYNWSDSQSDFG